MSFARIVAASLRHRGLVLVFALGLSLFGLHVARELPVDVLPDLTRPMVMVQTETAGLAPEDVESLVTFPVERALSGLQDITRLRSVSTPGLSVVYAEFGWDTDAFRNRQLVAERIDAIRSQLAPFAEPRIGPLTSLMGEIMLVGLSIAPDGHDARDVREFADWTLRPKLLSLPGVAQVIAIGGEVRQYEIQPDPQRLQLNGVTLAQVEQAATGFGVDTGASFADSGGAELALRSIGRPFRIEDLEQVAVAWRPSGDADGTARGPIRLVQIADVVDGTRLKRGDAGVDGHPAVILSIQKQPGADTLKLTEAVERVLATEDAARPAGSTRTTLFRQADFIGASITNVRTALLHGALIVAVVLILFLSGGRATAVSLVAIPLSVLVTILVLRLLGLSINTMTLGGLAIAVGELVDDAVVGVENAIRRLRENAVAARPKPILRVIADATIEVRSGILYATLLIVLVFVPLFALDGVEGRLFAPLGIAYITAILASLVVATTVTPALTAMVFAARTAPPHERGWLTRLKALYSRALEKVLGHPRFVLALTLLVLIGAGAIAVSLPRSFLPVFNERTLTLNLLLQPGVSLTESNRVGALAETLVLQEPDVSHVGRRTGRAEFDEHAEGLHYSELDVELKPNARPPRVVAAALRARLAALPGTLSIGQPIAHRLDHLLSGVQAPLAVKIFGDDLNVLRRLAGEVRERLAGVAGLSDVQIEAQAEVPQLALRVDARSAAEYGISPPRVQDALAALSVGRRLSQIVDGEKRFDLMLRWPQTQLDPATIGEQLFDTPAGMVPLKWLAEIKESRGPNQILREDLRRRIVVSAQSSGENFGIGAETAATQLAALPLPPGYTLRMEGQSLAQKQAALRIGELGLLSLLLMAAVLHARYRSLALSGIVLGTVPLAMAGGLAALTVSKSPLSVASLVGFITLAGIAARNGILKISHYLNLALNEGEAFGIALILRGSRERFTPVLMTSLMAGLALAPLLFAADAPGKEILHPVAVVIFGGLIGGTLLDVFVTPVLFLRYGESALTALRKRGGSADTF